MTSITHNPGGLQTELDLLNSFCFFLIKKNAKKHVNAHMMSNATPFEVSMCLLCECDRNDRFVCVVCVNVLHFISIRAVLVAVTSELRIAPQNVKDVLFGPNEYVAV